MLYDERIFILSEISEKIPTKDLNESCSVLKIIAFIEISKVWGMNPSNGRRLKWDTDPINLEIFQYFVKFFLYHKENLLKLFNRYNYPCIIWNLWILWFKYYIEWDISGNLLCNADLTKKIFWSLDLELEILESINWKFNVETVKSE